MRLWRRRRGLRFACHLHVEDIQWVGFDGKRTWLEHVEISFATTAACAKWRLQQILGADRFRLRIYALHGRDPANDGIVPSIRP